MFSSAVGAALLTQFKGHVQLKVNKGDASKDAIFIKILNGLSKTSTNAGLKILEQLLRWRGEVLQNSVHGKFGTDSILKSRLIIEVCFIEAAIRVVESNETLSSNHAHELERLAFDWLINADNYVEQRHKESVELKDRVVLAASKLLGALSYSSLDSITERFLAELGSRIRAEASSAARQEIYNLCHSLRFLRVNDSSPLQLKSSINFLENIFPLRHVASEKKSRLQHALCDVLSSVLAPLADERTSDPGCFGSNCDPALRSQWFSTITLLRKEILKWTTKQSKQIPAGYPLVTILTCIEEEGTLISSIDSLIECLHKQLRDKKNSSMALLCISRLVSSFLTRLSGRSDPDRLSKWVGRSTQPAIQGIIRGSLVAPEQCLLIHYLCTHVSHIIPEYAIQAMIIEMLRFESGLPWEAPFVAVRSLLHILSEAPGKVFGEQNLQESLPPTACALEALMESTRPGIHDLFHIKPLPETKIYSMGNLVQQGYCLYEILGVGHLAATAAESLDRIRAQCHQIYGFSWLTNSSRPVDHNPKERVSAVSVLVAVLDCIPFAIPADWRHDKSMFRSFVEDLPGYTIHAEASIRQATVGAITRSLESWAESRDEILDGLANLILNIERGEVEIIKELAALMLKLMSIWQQKVETNSELKSSWSIGQTERFDSLHSIECCGILLLCHQDVGVRLLGLDLLDSAAKLGSVVKMTHIGSKKDINVLVSDLHSSESEWIMPDRSSSSQFPIPSHSRSSSQQVTNSLLYGSSLESTWIKNEPLQMLNKSMSDQNTWAAKNWPSIKHRREMTMSSAFGPSEVETLPSSIDASLGEESSESSKYLIDILQQSGVDIIRSVYWDFGPYSDIQRIWRPLPQNLSFYKCMANAQKSDIRWSMILSQIMREAWKHARKSAAEIFLHCHRKLELAVTLDHNGKKFISLDGDNFYWTRMYAMLNASAPYDVCDNKSGHIAARMESFVDLLVNSARMGMENSVIILGSVHKSLHLYVIKAISSFKSEYHASFHEKRQGSLKFPRAKKDDLRVMHAQILRIISSHLEPDCLVSNVEMQDEFLRFIVESDSFIAVSGDVSPELQQLRFCLCIISRNIATQIAISCPQKFPPMLRKQLYNKFSLYSEEGQTPGLFRSELRRHVAAAKSAVKPRDPEQMKAIESSILTSSEMLEYAANMSMAAMLFGPSFDTDARSSNGRVFNWIQRLLESSESKEFSYHVTWLPKKAIVGKEALKNMLSSNLELIDEYVRHCYSSKPEIACAYFRVLCEVYLEQDAMQISMPTLISLILHKVVDPDLGVRTDARRLLVSMERRKSKNEDIAMNKLNGDHLVRGLGEQKMDSHTPDLVVVGSLQDSHVAFQQRLSSMLASEYSDIAVSVVKEILLRQKDCPYAAVLNRQLLCLPPWLENASFAQGSIWDIHILESLFDVSLLPGAIKSVPVQSIWTTISSNRGNIIPTLDFLLGKVVSGSSKDQKQENTEVGKHIALYLSRTAPRHSIDHLVHLAQEHLITSQSRSNLATHEDPKSTNAVDLGLIREFHHKQASAPVQQPLPQQQPLAAHAAAIVAATADGSKPFTASSFAQAIKRSTVDIIIKTGIAVADTVAVAGAAAVGTISASTLSSADEYHSSRAKYGEYMIDVSDRQEERISDPLDGQVTKLIPEDDNDFAKVASKTAASIAMSHSEGAICLMSEIVCENDEELRPHLPELLHIATLHLDSCNSEVRHEACLLLQYVLYNLSFKILHSNSSLDERSPYSLEYARVAAVIGFLQSVPKGEKIWDWELPTLSHPWVRSAGSVAAFVQIVAHCFPFDSALEERWSSEALKWACCSSARHESSRSHQVFCSLGPELTSTACTALLHCLEKCLRRATSEGLDTAIEILCTLRVLLSNTRDEKLLLYPHLFAACVALLNSSVVRVGELAIAMLIHLLETLDFANIVIQQTLISVFSNQKANIHDSSDEGNLVWIFGKSLMEGIEDVDEENCGPWMAMQQLLIKGFFQPETENLTFKCLGLICGQVYRASKAGILTGEKKPLISKQRFFNIHMQGLSLSKIGGFEAIFGDPCIGICITLASSLPWIFTKMCTSDLSSELSCFLKDLSFGCEAVGWHDLSALFLCLENDPAATLEPHNTYNIWSKEIMPILSKEIFPEYSLLFVQRIFEVVQRGQCAYQRAALCILQAFFGHADLHSEYMEFILKETHMIDLLALDVNGPLGSEVIKVLEAISFFSGIKEPGTKEAEDKFESLISWESCIDEIGECNKICSGALKNVSMNCPRTTELQNSPSNDYSLLPFLPN